MTKTANGQDVPPITSLNMDIKGINSIAERKERD